MSQSTNVRMNSGDRWRRSKNEHLSSLGLTSGSGGDLFGDSTDPHDLFTKGEVGVMELDELQAENRKLRGQVKELTAQMKLRDEEIEMLRQKLSAVGRTAKIVSATAATDRPTVSEWVSGCSTSDCPGNALHARVVALLPGLTPLNLVLVLCDGAKPE